MTVAEDALEKKLPQAHVLSAMWHSVKKPPKLLYMLTMFVEFFGISAHFLFKLVFWKSIMAF